MWLTMIRVLALATLIASVCCVPVNICDIDAVRSFTRINSNFDKGLLDVLGKEEGNLFFSPSSITRVLVSIFFGSSGATSEQLLGLGYLSIRYENFSAINPLLGYCLEFVTALESTSDEYTLERADALLVQKDYPILEEYQEVLRNLLGTVAKEVDFAGHSERAVEKVNRWVTEKTQGKITKLVDNLDESTRLMLLSAIYFKGTWQTEFDPENTKPRPFYNYGKSSPKSVPTMKLHTEFPFLYDAVNQYRVLQLPYKGDDISMLVFLPFERDGIDKLQDTITFETITDVLKRVRKTEVTVSLPKFKLQYSKSLKEDLTTAGLGAMFSSDADFSRITGNKDLYVSDIVHKAVIEVNEEGSEAAAVTGAVMVPVSLPLPNLRNVFNVDHSFLFFIVDNRSGSSLFMGRVHEL